MDDKRDVQSTSNSAGSAESLGDGHVDSTVDSTTGAYVYRGGDGTVRFLCLHLALS
jgi:hypothetical protein